MFEEVQIYDRFYWSCFNGNYILNRFPGRKDDTSQDEIIASAVLRFLHSQYNLSYSHGIAYSWCYNLKHPERFDLRYWFQRHLDFVPIMKATARQQLTWLERVSWALCVIKTSFDKREESSGKLLRFIQFPAMIHRYWITDLAIWFFLLRVNVKEAYEIYFGKAHPFSRNCPERVTISMVGNRQFRPR